MGDRTPQPPPPSHRLDVYQQLSDQLLPDELRRLRRVLDAIRREEPIGSDQVAVLLVLAHQARTADDGALYAAFDSLAYATALDLYADLEVAQFRAELDADPPAGPPEMP